MCDGFIYIKIQKGMYGLPQAGIIAQELLKKCLNKHGYRQSPLTPGLWRHDFRPIIHAVCGQLWNKIYRPRTR
jgi:hypothetical protein